MYFFRRKNMNRELIEKLSKSLDRDKLVEVISKYLELVSGKYDETLNVPILRHEAADAIYAVIWSDDIYSECTDEFLECVEDVKIFPLSLNIEENLERLIKLSKMFGDTHEWSCNDDVKLLYIDVVIAILLNSEDVYSKMNIFIKEVKDIDL